MKKIYSLFLILAITLFPVSTLAYSDRIIPGGESIGIEINTDGIIIVGFYKIDGKYNKKDLRVGDIITKVGDKFVKSSSELMDTLEENMIDNKAEITIKRDDKERKVILNLIYSEGIYKTGLYIKDSITGIGTLSYIDPETRIYGALGHEIVESNTNKLIKVGSGYIFRSSITGIDRSVRGIPGGKNAKFYSSDTYGLINKNSLYGIYGNYTNDIDYNNIVEVGDIDEVNLGPAIFYTVIDGEKKEAFDIEITKIDKNSEFKNIFFNITDTNLIEKTGGIIQGMSGSPIIQNDKIIGVVTHVVISNPVSGYGINIKTMLEAGEK